MAVPDVWAVAREPGVLTEKQLQILELRERRGFSWNQISTALNCSRANVREHHAAATRRLARRLERDHSVTTHPSALPPETTKAPQ